MPTLNQIKTIPLRIKYFIDDINIIDKYAGIEYLAELLYSKEMPEIQKNKDELPFFQNKWQTDCIQHAFYLCFQKNDIDDNLPPFLHFIEKISAIEKDISSLGYDALSYRLNPVNPLDVFDNLSFYCAYDAYRKKICLLLKFILDYNQKRGSKKTPTYTQARLYWLKKNLHLSIPNNSFSDVLDNDIYALEEYSALSDNIEFVLLKTNNDTMDQLIKKFYPNYEMPT
jgi:hypothetical protein